MKVIRLQGNHYQMGYQHGREVLNLRPVVLETIERRLSLLPQAEQGLKQRAKELLEALESLDQPVMQMLRGIADALNVEFTLLFEYAMASYLEDWGASPTQQVAVECTVWAASDGATADGQPLLVKNRDRPEQSDQQLIALAQPEHGYRYGYITSAGAPGVFSSGLNEAGLAVADARVRTVDVGPGLPSFSLMMHLLEEHATVSSALDYLTNASRLGGSNLVLADAGGNLAVFESGHHNCGVIKAENSFVVSTNHFVTPQLCSKWIEKEEPHLRGNSQRRYEVVREALQQAWGRIDVAWAQELMARHGGPLDSLCRHAELGGCSVTISTTILLPATRSFWACFGHPCQGKYHFFFVKEDKG